MASENEIEHIIDSSEDEEEEEEEEIYEHDDPEEEGSLNGGGGGGKTAPYDICGPLRRRRGEGGWWPVGSDWVQEWNRVFLLVCAAGLFVDPLFFYSLSISEACMCLFVDGWLAVTVTALRCMTDALHLWNMWVQLKMAARKDVNRRHRLQGRNTAARAAVRGYLKAKAGFFFELFVILPLPQIVLWVATPALMKSGSTRTVMSVFLIIFLFQYLPKIYHFVRLLRRVQNLSGYIFGTIWWGIALNMIAYFVASHAAGACWYLLGIQRATKCLTMQCEETSSCDLMMRTIACQEPIYYGTRSLVTTGWAWEAWANNKAARSTCILGHENFEYGAYKWTLQLITNDSRLEKVLFPIFWGLMTLSTFGNLESTTEWPEVVFNIIILTSGLILVTMLIGNIKVFLNATTSKKQAMQLRMRNLEGWMRKRQLPQGFRQRVRQYERQRWAAMRGVDEYEMIRNLPEGLRKDIKYHLCLDLVKQVPLFHYMDELVLENICDRVKSLIFPKGETISREGDPVKRMLFIVRGHVESSQVLRDGVKSCCMLGPGNFSGDELLSWCLRRPFIDRLPPSSFTLVTLETTEAFGLEADDVKYVTQHFRYTFVNDRVNRSARYYSPRVADVGGGGDSAGLAAVPPPPHAHIAVVYTPAAAAFPELVAWGG